MIETFWHHSDITSTTNWWRKRWSSMLIKLKLEYWIIEMFSRISHGCWIIRYFNDYSKFMNHNIVSVATLANQHVIVSTFYSANMLSIPWSKTNTQIRSGSWIYREFNLIKGLQNCWRYEEQLAEFEVKEGENIMGLLFMVF